MHISIIGAGYVGLVSAGCFAQLGNDVICADIDSNKIKMLNEGKSPIYEPGLEALIQEHLFRRLKFTTNVKDAIKHGEVIFSCVGTPSKNDGSADISAVLSVAEQFASVVSESNEYKVFVIKSTVPPGTARKCFSLIKEKSDNFSVVSNPEFLKEGSAIQDFLKPDRIIIGSPDKTARKKVLQAYHGVLRVYIPVLEIDKWETAELIKYANNAFLATKITFANELANIAERIGADIEDVIKALGMDYRINPRFLHPGIGFGGSCLPKDLKALITLAREHDYSPKFFEQVLVTNEQQKVVILEKLKRAYPSLSGKTFAILGLSFKPKTDDMREAPSITLINSILSQGAKVKAYDPKAIERAKEIFQEKITYCNSIEEAVKDTDGIIIVTEWDEFRDIDFKNLGKIVKEKKVFDGRNIYDPKQIREAGFEYYGIGRA